MGNLSITAANVMPSAAAKLVRRVATVTITAGQPVCLVTATTVGIADGDGTFGASRVYGIAVNSATYGQPVTVCLKDPALVIGATVVVGNVYILSATAGLLADVTDLASGMYCTVCCVANSTTTVNWAPLAAGAVKP